MCDIYSVQLCFYVYIHTGFSWSLVTYDTSLFADRLGLVVTPPNWVCYLWAIGCAFKKLTYSDSAAAPPQELLLPTQKHLGGDRHTYIDTQRWYFVLYFILCVHALHETMHPALARMQGRYLCTELQNWFATSSPHNKTTLWLLVLALNWCANILRIISRVSVSSSLCEWSRMSPCHGAKAQD